MNRPPDDLRSGRADRGAQAVAGDIDFDRLAEVLRALSHPVRVKIVAALSGGELCVKDLESILGISQPAVSQHLMRLRYAGLIESERRGHLVCYRLAGERATRILGAIVNEFEKQ